jgi:ribosomal protein L11 methyltransferase
MARAANATASVSKMLAAARKRRLLPSATLEHEDVRSDAWAHKWKERYKPFCVCPGLYIAPRWKRDFKAPRGNKTIRMDPGMAFGTGQHATTQLVLSLLLPRVEQGDVVLDIGSGSGILALAAAQRKARVYASDVDPIAVRATRENFVENKLKAVAVLQGRGVPASFPRANVITANLTSRVLMRLAPALVRKLAPGGVLITSGILKGAAPKILGKLSRHGLELVETGGRAQLGHKNDQLVVTAVWRAFVHRKRARA